MKNFTKYHGLFVVFMVLLLIYQLFHITHYELQPWDEALYAVRAKHIVEGGNWLDQTSASVNGLYSSVHPPIYIWLTAASVKAFGEQMIWYRIWSLIFGVGILILLFSFFKDKRKGLFAVILIGSIPYFLAYFHLGQLDTAYCFFILWSLFFQKKFLESDRMKYAALSGMTLGLALMSKMLVGLLIPASIATTYLLIIIRDQRRLKQLIIAFGMMLAIGLAMALPWHLYMFHVHGKTFINSIFGYHLLERVTTGIESNTSSLGPLFFVNQLVIQFSIPLFFGILIAWKKIRKFDTVDLLLLSYFIIPFFIFSLSATKLRTYTFPMMLPLALFTARYYDEVEAGKKLRLAAVVLIPLIGLWSVNQAFRDNIQSLGIPDTVSLLLLAVTMALVFFMRKNINLVILLVMIFLISRPFYYQGKEYRENNFKEAAAVFNENGLQKLVYIDKTEGRDDPLLFFYFDFMRSAEKDDRYEFRSIIDPIPLAPKTLLIFNRKHLQQHQIDKRLKRIQPGVKLHDQNDYYATYIIK